MSELPIQLQQLIESTAAELGLGTYDKMALKLALTRAFTLGMKHADKITQDEYTRNKRDESGS